MFDHYTQVQMSRAETIGQLARIQKTIGKIEDGVNSHYVYEGHEDDPDWFGLYYIVHLKEMGKIWQVEA